MFNDSTGQNDNLAEDVLFQIVPLKEKFEYAFQIIGEDNDIIMRTKVKPSCLQSINKEAGVFMWIHESTLESGELGISAYNFYFTEGDDKYIENLSQILSKITFEVQTGVEYEENVKEDDMDWMADGFIEDIRDDEEAKSEYEPEKDMYSGFDDVSMANDDNDAENQEYENAGIVQAFDYDRAFVARGDGYGVYSANDKNKMQYYGDFNIIEEYQGKPAENMLLHDGETKLLFIDPSRRDKIQCYDFQKEKVVEEWEAKGGAQFKSFFHEQKNAQVSGNQQIIACSEKGMFTLDPRINKANKEASSKVYATNYFFTKIAATYDGKIAVGSKNGEIRLYTKMGQNAKTVLPGTGENIIAMDSTKDGKFILLTHRNYILLIRTTCSNGKTGFEHKMGKEKPKPKKLKLSNNDIITHKLSNCSFTKASFDNSENSDETIIVASIGDYVVIWKLKQVLKGNIGKYDINKVYNSVIASECRYNTDNELLVTMTKSVTKQSRKRRNQDD